MKRVRILTNKLYKKDRNGNETTFRFPVLTIFISDKNCSVINSRLQNHFNIEVDRFDIDPYKSEIPNVLYIDHPLVLTHTYQGWYLCPVNQAGY